MPRRQFVSDLQEASELGSLSRLINVSPGGDDGTISCTFVPSGTPAAPIDIQLLVPDISDYPQSHYCMAYTTNDGDVPAAVTAALEGLPEQLMGLSISDMLQKLSDALENSLTRLSRASSVQGDDSDAIDADQLSDDEPAEELGYSDVEDIWSPQSPSAHEPYSQENNSGNIDRASESASKLAGDLTLAKLAGFRVGYLGSPAAPIVCISCRISKLGISDEAMEAWQVDSRQYLVLMIRYVEGYQPLEEILRDDERLGNASIELHVDLCDSYKPTNLSAVNAFHLNKKATATNPSEQEDNDSSTSARSRTVTQSFISRPLNTLLRDRFVKILRYRYSYGFAWGGAEQFFNDFQGKSVGDAEPSNEKYLTEEEVGSPSTVLPLLVTSDHLTDEVGPAKSFPLVAMQFVLRHFVRCTEFCLVCHCKTNDAFEALKPYVCSNSLCLFQYMSLGFGPSLEWEIRSQPYVVDLLISFTYASAMDNRLSDFPTGLGFLVPASYKDPYSSNHRLNKHGGSRREYRATLDRGTMELTFSLEDTKRPFSTGDWIIISNPMGGDWNDVHCRVRDMSLWPTVRLSPPVHAARGSSSGPEVLLQNEARLSYSGRQSITFVVYDENFDDLKPEMRRAMITTLLETLPTVDEMKAYITEPSNAPPSLANWRDRISKSALDVLRWIVASNRSCILQESPTSQTRTSDDRVYGMDGYMQFRFAQGAPDKEQRFIQSVAEVSQDLPYPTLFAWHGSPLGNWHGIVREGLHFRDTLHGRAFGNGVYMSTNFGVSGGYARIGSSYGGTDASMAWPQSKLKATSAISLNEVVNKPARFVSNSPHFVVSQLDWIQTRYLFVQGGQGNGMGSMPKASRPAVYYEQDPEYKAHGPLGSAVIVPITAFSQQRRLTVKSVQGTSKSGTSQPAIPPNTVSPAGGKTAGSGAQGKKKRLKGIFGKKVSKGSKSSQESSKLEDGKQEDPWASEDTDPEDLEILFVAEKESKGKETPKVPPPPPAKVTSDDSKTDYIPGTLDGASLPLLGAPAYATPSASQSLQRELKATLKIQDSSPLHELGWYVDPELIGTVYQWIVELHSFDKDLPLARDLRHAGLQSVVTEIRFPKDYPMSPPFVRVIRPRFLGFQQGGGGHVTLGGALCMELLTNTGWSAVSNIESVLLQVRMALSSKEPQPARLEKGQDAKRGTVREYGVAEAIAAYVRACRLHGWEIPKDFEREGRQTWAPLGQ